MSSDSPDVERRLHGDRTLLTRPVYEDGVFVDDVPGWADIAYESIRAMNHITMGAHIPAPTAYRVLGNVSGVAAMLPQLLDQLGAGLERSLTTFDVYDDEREPAESVAAARQHLVSAVALIEQAAKHLSEAQVAISSQGYGR